MTLKRVTYTKWCYALCVFCFLQFFPIASEVQPFAVVLCGLALISSRMLIDWRILAASLIYVLFFVIGGLGVIAGHISVFAFVSSAAALSFGPVVYSYFSREGLPAGKLNERLVFFLSLFAIVQVLKPELLELTGLAAAIRVFIPRFTSEMLSEWDRGVTLLAPEPANMAPIIFMLLVIFLLRVETLGMGMRRTILSSVSLGILVLTNKSLTLYLILIVFLLSYVVLRFQTKGLLALIFSFGVMLLFVSDGEASQGSRLVSLIFALGTLSVDSLISLDNLSGARFTTVYVSLLGLGDIGQGFGSWEFRFIELGQRAPFDFFASEYWRLKGGAENLKPASILAVASIDMGAFAVIYVGLLLLWIIGAGGLISRLYPVRSAAAVCSLFMILLGGYPVTLPAFWVVLGVCKYLAAKEVGVDGTGRIGSNVPGIRWSGSK